MGLKHLTEDKPETCWFCRQKASDHPRNHLPKKWWGRRCQRCGGSAGHDHTAGHPHYFDNCDGYLDIEEDPTYRARVMDALVELERELR